jgi:membrane protein implicated in regulation of membrane protease activity
LFIFSHSQHKAAAISSSAFGARAFKDKNVYQEKEEGKKGAALKQNENIKGDDSLISITGSSWTSVSIEKSASFT